MTLKPQDIVVLLKLLALSGRSWTYVQLALEVGMSQSEVHAALKRALAARLAVQHAEVIRPNVRNLEEFVIHGLRFVFMGEKGELTRGVPTAAAAPPLAELFLDSSEPPLVWPDAEGEVRGMAFSPLYRSVPKAARADRALYELLALVDALRVGRSREHNLAVKELHKRFESYGQSSKP